MGETQNQWKNPFRINGLHVSFLTQTPLGETKRKVTHRTIGSAFF